MSQRLSYIDIARGILIILVIISHVNWISNDIYQINNAFFKSVYRYDIIYTSFYMPAFFIITGMCTNFNKSIKTYLNSNIKSILIPGLLFGSLIFLFSNTFTSFSQFINLTILQGSAFWFLTALFVSKIIVWFIINFIKNAKYRIIAILILPLVGYCLHNINIVSMFNPWKIIHALDLSIFLGLGYILKNIVNKSNILCLLTLLFIFIISINYIVDANNSIPYVFSNYKINSLWLLFCHIVISLSGSSLLLLLSKYIGFNKYLEFIGTQTLVIYMVHTTFVRCILDYTQVFIESTNIMILSVILWGSIILITLALSLLISHICNLKYFRFILGKF